MKTQYSKIAEEYAATQDKRKLRFGITDPSLYEAIGNLEGLDVLDLACGDGRLSREFKLRGARKVVGVDLEPKMIDLALEEERKLNQGIKYFVERVGQLQTIGKFDLVVPGFLLHYAESREELFYMCQDIYKNLKVGGRMIGINQNPDNPRNRHKKYGSTVETLREPVQEGDLIRVTLWNKERKTMSFENYHWNKSTYETCLTLAGFKDIKWIPMHASSEAIKKYGEEFWQDWLNSPSLVILEARK